MRVNALNVAFAIDGERANEMQAIKDCLRAVENFLMLMRKRCRQADAGWPVDGHAGGPNQLQAIIFIGRMTLRPAHTQTHTHTKWQRAA